MHTKYCLNASKINFQCIQNKILMHQTYFSYLKGDNVIESIFKMYRKILIGM